MDDAEELHRQAVEAGNAHNYALALELIDQARKITDDPHLVDRLDVTAAYGSAELGRNEDAAQLCERVLGREGALPLATGLANSQLALVLMRIGDADRAQQHFATAASQLAGMPEHLGITFMNRGILSLHQGDAAPAVEDLLAAAEQFERAGDTLQRAKAVHNLGYAYLLRGDLVAAIRNMDEVSDVLGSQSPALRAIINQDRAEVLIAAGLTRDAVAALEEAASAYGEEGLRRFQAECEFVLAKTLMADDPERARTVATSAARRFRDYGSRPWALRSQAVAAIAEIGSGGTGIALLRRCDDLVTSLRAEGRRPDADVLGLHAARLAVRRGEVAEAAVRLARVRTTRDSPVTTRLLTREVRGELAEAQQKPARMRRFAQQGLDELHSWQATFGSLDLQSSTVGHGQHLARLGLRAAMADGSPEVVFEWSERARALASRVTALRPPPDPALAADLTALRQADPEDRAKARLLKERIRSHSWFAATGSVAEPVPLAELRASLARDDSALVAHIVLDGRLTALAVTATSTSIVQLGAAGPIRSVLDRVAADLDFAAQNRTGGIAEAVRGSLRADLGALADRLVRPLLSTIGYRRLVLTPSALLAGTPWNCLPGLIGRPLTIPTSATRWVEQTATPLRPPTIAGFVAGPRLQRAEEEVRRSAAAWPAAQSLAGPAADAARAGWLASHVDLFHIAGHGHHPGDHPLFSAIELADGPWFGHDVDLLPRIPAVVVLSACDLGRSTVLHGEETVGMSAAWLHAGARTVISSPALLADELACEVLGEWHQHLADGSAPADALAQVTAGTEEIVPLLTFGAGW